MPKHVVVTYYLAINKEKIGDTKHTLPVHLHVPSQVGCIILNYVLCMDHFKHNGKFVVQVIQ